MTNEQMKLLTKINGLELDISAYLNPDEEETFDILFDLYEERAFDVMASVLKKFLRDHHGIDTEDLVHECDELMEEY